MTETPLRREYAFPATRQLDLIISQTRYKAGWEFKVNEDVFFSRFDGQGELQRHIGSLWITVNTVNTYPPHQSMPIGMSYAIHDVALSDERLCDWLRDCIRWMETHEMDEWLVVGGKRPYDPHRTGYVMPSPPSMPFYASPGYRYPLA